MYKDIPCNIRDILTLKKPCSLLIWNSNLAECLVFYLETLLAWSFRLRKFGDWMELVFLISMNSLFSYSFKPQAVSFYEFNSLLIYLRIIIGFYMKLFSLLGLLLLLYRISLICYSFISSLLLNLFKCLVILLCLIIMPAWRTILISIGSCIAFLFFSLFFFFLVESG